MPQQSSSQEGYVPLVERDADQVGGAGAPSIQRGVPGGVGGRGFVFIVERDAVFWPGASI